MDLERSPWCGSCPGYSRSSTWPLLGGWLAMQSIRNKYPRWSPAQWQGAYWAHTRPWVQSLVTTSLSTQNVQYAVPSQGGRAPVSFAGSSGDL